eukprot:3937813-Rhodomonas_salina.1
MRTRLHLCGLPAKGLTLAVPGRCSRTNSSALVMPVLVPESRHASESGSARDTALDTMQMSEVGLSGFQARTEKQ